jgi:hypothetical protein
MTARKPAQAGRSESKARPAELSQADVDALVENGDAAQKVRARFAEIDRESARASSKVAKRASGAKAAPTAVPGEKRA